MTHNLLSKRTLLITGATGLLGRNCIPLLIEEYIVYAIVREKPIHTHPNVIYLVMDLAMPWDESKLPNSIDVILHLAQSTQFREFPNGAIDVFKVNVETTTRLIQYGQLHGCQTFLYCSSGGVYGGGSSAFSENSPIAVNQPLGFYIASKCCAELLIKNYSNLMNVQIVRPFFIYGEGQNSDMLIPRLIHKIRSKETITLEGENGIRINPIYVADAAIAVCGLIQKRKSLTINIAGPEVLTLRDVAFKIGKLVGEKPILDISSNKGSDLVADITLLKKLELGPTTSFERGAINITKLY